MPVWPGSKALVTSQRTMEELASFGVTVKSASRSVRAEPATYSSRVVRLSLTTIPEMGRWPWFLY